MAEDKLTIATLHKALAQKAGCTEEVAGTFLTRLFPVIIAGLKEDKQVRINGLGTFKLQWNEPRKSVNIQTGEAITIDGYNKVVFTPETSLKEQINEPFAHLEPVYLDGNAPEPTPAPFDPMQKFSEQAEEIKDLLAELGGIQEEPEVEPQEESVEEIVVEETEKVEEVEVKEVVEETVEETEEVVSQVETPYIAFPTPENESYAANDAEAVETPLAASPVEEKPKEEKQTTAPTKQQDKKPFNAWLVAGITMLVFCIFLVGAFFFLQHKIVSWADSLLEKSQTTVVVPEVENRKPEVEAIIPPTDTIKATEQPKAEIPVEKAEKVEEPVQSTYTEFIKTETLTEGSRLTWLSRKYYGAPDFWVYIYEANKDILPNPNAIPVGTKIRIPKLPAVLIDTKNPESMQQAQALHNQILGQ